MPPWKEHPEEDRRNSENKRESKGTAKPSTGQDKEEEALEHNKGLMKRLQREVTNYAWNHKPHTQDDYDIIQIPPLENEIVYKETRNATNPWQRKRQHLAHPSSDLP